MAFLTPQRKVMTKEHLYQDTHNINFMLLCVSPTELKSQRARTVLYVSQG